VPVQFSLRWHRFGAGKCVVSLNQLFCCYFELIGKKIFKPGAGGSHL
jgi:hypothetical protein